MPEVLKAPFPYFGGKSTVAHIVWEELGNPAHYIEPFFGSGAVLLLRPDYIGQMESVCDKDGFVANVWRALKADPDGVAEWCDWPVNHADLIARRKKLIANEAHLLENLCKDDEWYDAKLAGYWVWAASCWIGSGLTCHNARPHLTDDGKGAHAKGQIPHIAHDGNGVHAKGKIPHIAHDRGVHAKGKRPHIAHDGKGVHAKGKIPHIAHDRGVHAKGQIPHLTCDNGVHAKTYNLYYWFYNLQHRLRRVRVVCGDYTRVLGGNWQDKKGVCGIFFDPPYGVTDRCMKIYRHDSTGIAKGVEDYCLKRGDDPNYRIVVAGYEEYTRLVDAGWRTHNWKTQGGYGNLAKAQGQANRSREMLYFSPHCVGSQITQESLWY